MGAQDLGRQLRRARQHLGLSLHDVHALTAIPLECVAALEQGDLTQLPSPVYARGYIRSYAEAVRLDGDRLALELWRCMDEAQVAAARVAHGAGPRPRGRSVPPPPPPTSRPRERQRSRAANGHRPSSLATLRQPTSPWVPKPGRIKRMAPALERTAIAVLLIVLAVGIWDLERARPVHRPSARAQPAAASQPEPTTPPPATPSAASPPSQPAAVATTPVSDTGSLATYATAAGHFNVVVQATDAACWLQVRAAAGGPVLFEGTLQPGQTQPFDANGTLWVRLGNLGHATVQVNGRQLTLPNKPSFPYNLLLQT
ncbi:MAG: DUF4115 domain-containing protein [Acidimicrobiia bacterium]|nr:DUF4115 domain-containing protein [Acidimicrobiia bacterium]